MFDPTVYDNLKVGFENYLYDLDNLDEIIHISNRKDSLEMASMSREFVLQFVLREHSEVKGEIILRSSLEALAAEILESPGSQPGCRLELRFSQETPEPDRLCPAIRSIIQVSWPGQRLVQDIHFVYGEEPIRYNVSSHVYFDRNVNEDQMGDIPELCEHLVNVLKKLVQLHN
ncbi:MULTISPECIES: hypothetical protein [Paenibacillus]|uniref:Uncharacterized protein n=1 Tax=Paenibacillus illinoisensis TaxID=59845 RepID=A0A2W0CPI5_9BACL|nr:MULTISPECIES: hypothetical protein [Paenibacillus]PAD31082.1 hypothetical protein CHH60_14260 [Paenibacillus sp. 7523-1]PYY25551.1 Uncharacterized protein PIL02S_06544 [Paenibacillus illinoisensis]